MPKEVKDIILDAEEQGKRLASQAVIASLAVSSSEIVSNGISDDPLQVGFSVTEFAKSLQTVAIDELQKSIVDGYLNELEGRQKMAQERGSNLEIEFELTLPEEQELFRFPVLGHDLLEISTHLTQNVTFAVQSIMAQLSMGAITPQELPTKIQDAQQVFATQLSSNVITIMLGGAQAAREQFRRAISAD